MLQTRRMCRETIKIMQITQRDALLKHLHFKYEDISRKINEVINIPPMKQKRGLLDKVLTALFDVNDEAYSGIDELQRDQLVGLQTATEQNILLNAHIEAYHSAILDRLEEFGEKLNSVIRSVNEITGWIKRIDAADISVQVVSAYLTAVNYYEELYTKYTRIVSTLNGRGDLLRLVTRNALLRTINDVLNKIGPSFDIFYILI